MTDNPPIQFERDGICFCTAFSDEHLKHLFDYLAYKVDNRLEAALYTQIMNRYTFVSTKLEEKNRLLAISDARRLEAQRLAQLANWTMHLPDGRLEWSETMYTLLEIDADETPTIEKFMQKMNPEDQPMVAADIEKLFAGQSIPELTYRVVMQDGTLKWLYARHVLDLDANGKPAAFHGTLQDITTTKLAEEKLKRYSDHLEELVNEKAEEIRDSQLTTIYALVKLAESRDDDTGEHIQRTSEYCRILATQLKAKKLHTDQVDDAFIRNIVLASPLHDIGKVGIPDYILLKPGKLTPEEFEVMKTHVDIGYNTLSSVEKMYPGNMFLRTGMDIALYHHEKWNGGGYQAGLSGEAIPLSARIMALSDVYDALRSRRVYKEPFTHEKTMQLIRDGRGTHFDPILVDILVEFHDQFRDVFDQSRKS